MNQFPIMKNPMIMSTVNSAMMPSHAVSGTLFIQCFPKAMPKIAAAMSPNTVIRITAMAIWNSKSDSARIIPSM